MSKEDKSKPMKSNVSLSFFGFYVLVPSRQEAGTKDIISRKVKQLQAGPNLVHAG